jgi:Fe-S-cluster containining protein
MTPAPKRYDCTRCPGYCCSYDLIEVTDHDLVRPARHHGLSVPEARRRFTKFDSGKRVLRHRRDRVFRSTCLFFDREARRCTVYEARPFVCRRYPTGARCGYFDFLVFEREQQGDEEFVPLQR